MGIGAASCAIFCYFYPVMTALTARSFRRPCFGFSSQPADDRSAGLEGPYPRRNKGSHRHSWAAREASCEDEHSSVEEA